MSDVQKRPYAHMHKVANGLVERLRPDCHRIEIAGSLRRKKEMIGDIELVAIPILQTNLFGEPTDTSQVDTLLASWPVHMIKNGAKYKQFTFYGNGGYPYTVDLFLQPDPATWGVNMLIRTGSADFSHRMVTPIWRNGYMPDGLRVKDARVWRDGVALDTPEEFNIFNIWNMEWIEPENREERVIA